MYKLFIAAVGLALASGLAHADSWDRFDGNADGKISKDEFHGTAADVGIFPESDLNRDGLLDENELGATDDEWDFDAWDANDDELVDSNEFYDGYFDAYDGDADGYWNDTEWDDAGEAGWFDV